MSHLANTPALADLDRLAIGDIAVLPPYVLLDLQATAHAETARVKKLRDRLEAGIAQRYEAAAIAERAAQGKTSGTVRIEDDGIVVIADLPKKVTWDQDHLATMAARIQAAGDDPAEYVDIAFKVPERKYAAWPDAIRSSFEPARTMRPGALKIEILPQGGDR